MHPSISPINNTMHLVQGITRQLGALDSLQLPKESLHAVRLLQLRRLTRRIETLIPGHFGHGERTAHYACLLGKAISLTDDQHIELHYAALLHDIGLLTLPGRLLDETAAHSLDDYALIQSHSREGAALLSPYRFLSGAARLIAHHHERWDGAGYPYGLRGVYIPMAARILAIADVFDSIAIRSTSLHKALRALQASAGSQFDPILTAEFCAQLRDQDQLPPLSFGDASVAALTVEPTVDRPSHQHMPFPTFCGVQRKQSIPDVRTIGLTDGAE